MYQRYQAQVANLKTLSEEEIKARMDALTEHYRRLCEEMKVEANEEELSEPARRLQERLRQQYPRR